MHAVEEADGHDRAVDRQRQGVEAEVTFHGSQG
jgi:hypothetical protein